MKFLQQVRCYFLLLILLFFSSSIFAQAAPISSFDVRQVASSNYNPTLPSPLTPLSAFNLINWDIVPGTSPFKSTNNVHGGVWIAFITRTMGYTLNGSHPTASYNGAGVNYFGDLFIVNSSNVVIGFYHEYYCDFCPSQASFHATVNSIFPGGSWSANMFVN